MLAQEETRLEQMKSIEVATQQMDIVSITDQEELCSHDKNKSTKAAQSGGFHAINLSLSSTARSALMAFLEGSQIPVPELDRVTELAINEEGTALELVVSKLIRVGTDDDLDRALPVDHDYPRFILYAMSVPRRRGRLTLNPI
jgi:hypothetical protein